MEAGTIVGILGGTGPQGHGLAYRFARGGLDVLIGSRSARRAASRAAEISALPGVRATVTGADNPAASERCDLAVIAVPWPGHAETAASLREGLAGKVVVDCVNPLGFDERGAFALAVPEGSAAQQAQSLLPDSRVCAAFHHVSSRLLGDPAVERIDLDVLVLGEDREAVSVVLDLAGVIPGVRGVYAGRLRNAGPIEALTASLIAINRRYRTQAGLRVTNLPA